MAIIIRWNRTEFPRVIAFGDDDWPQPPPFPPDEHTYFAQVPFQWPIYAQPVTDEFALGQPVQLDEMYRFEQVAWSAPVFAQPYAEPNVEISVPKILEEEFDPLVLTRVVRAIPVMQRVIARGDSGYAGPPPTPVLDDDPGQIPRAYLTRFVPQRQSTWSGFAGAAVVGAMVDNDPGTLAQLIQQSQIVAQPYADDEVASFPAQITDDFAYWQFSVPSDGIAQPPVDDSVWVPQPNPMVDELAPIVFVTLPQIVYPQPARDENELPEGIALEYELSGPMLSIPPVFFRQPLGDDGDWSNGQAVLIVGPFGPTISGWTADSGVVTADSINFTCDGADLINGGGSPVPNPGRLASSVSVPLLPSGLYKGST